MIFSHKGLFATVFTVICFCISLAAFADIKAKIWDFSSNSSQGWGQPHKLDVQFKQGAALLEIKAADSSITNNNTGINSALLRRVEIRYRATGLPQHTTGQIFYADTAKPQFIGRRYWILPSLKSDGQWHTLKLDADKGSCLQSGTADWVRSGLITRLRLDMVDQPSGKIEIKYIKFLPPAKKQLVNVKQTGLKGILLPFRSFNADGTRKIVVPEGKYYVWARVKAQTDALTELKKLEINGKPLYDFPIIPKTLTGDYQWRKLGMVKLTRALTLKLPQYPSDTFDVLLFTKSRNTPRELPESDWPLQVKTEIKRGQEEKVAIPVKSFVPSWGGGMATAASDIPARCPRSYYLRRTFIVPANLKNAWLQITADDSFKVDLNGSRVNTHQGDAWWHPGCAEVSKYLKPGQKNIVTVCYHNGGGQGGVLLDLTLNFKDNTYKKIFTDSEFKSFDTYVKGWENLSFNDSNWRKVRVSPKLPTYPWLIKVPYQIKYQCPAAEIKILSYNPEISVDKPFSIKLQLDSKVPFKSDDAFWIKVFDKHGGVLVAKDGYLKDFDLEKKSDKQYCVNINNLVFPKYYSGNQLTVKAGVYGYNNTTLDNKVMLSVRGEALPGALITEISTKNGFPEVLINGKAVYPVIGNTAYYSGQSLVTADNSGFAKIPVDIKSFWIGGIKVPWWIGPEKYDFAAIDKCFDRVLRQYKNALIIPWVWVMPSPWWQKLHPDEVALGSNGKPWAYYVSTPTFSSKVYQTDAKKAISAFIRHCEEKYGSRVFGYNLVGGVSAEWQGWGCHQADRNDILQDYSKAAQRDFASYVQKHYAGKLKETKIPSVSARLKKTLGVLRDPATDLAAIVYDEYYSNAISDCIINIASAAKEAAGRKKLIGMYYGYSSEYSNLRYCLNLSGHNAMRKVLNSKNIDFLMSPPSYGVRAIGDCGEDMKPFTSIALAGKLAIIDDDTRTHLTGPKGHHQTINKEQTTAVFRRNLGQAICRQQVMCLFPIEAGNDHDSPEIRHDIRIARQAGQYSYDNKLQRNSEIAVFVDDKTFKYLSYQKEFDLRPDEPLRIFGHDGHQYVYPQSALKLSGDLIYYQRSRIARIGAPVDYLLLSDLDKCIGKYKLYIFLNCFQYDRKIQNVVDKLKTTGTTALWLYAPGFFNNNSGSLENMRHLLGMKFGMINSETAPLTDIQDFSDPFTVAGLQKTSFGTSGKLRPLFYVDDADAKILGHYRETGKASLAVKKVGKSNFIFCGSNAVSADLLSSIASGAGVHLFSRSSDTIFEGAGFLTMHSRCGGKKEISLKQKSDVIDIFSGEIIARNVNKFTIEMPALQTRVFFLGNADEFRKYMKYK